MIRDIVIPNEVLARVESVHEFMYKGRRLTALNIAVLASTTDQETGTDG